METMKAVRIHRYGGPEVLKYEDAPRTEPAEGELLVEVIGAGVNPVDWKIREGRLQNRLKFPLPFVPGWDLAGIVAGTGTGVTRFKTGDHVYAHPHFSPKGTYAQYAVVVESEATLKPKSIDYIHAAGAPLCALSAWQALFDAAHLQAGQTVLIHGAAGGVGTFAVQLAKWRGARVIGTASGGNLEFIRSLGVDLPLNYMTTPFEGELSDVDVVLDTIGGETQERSWRVLKKDGILVSIVSPPSDELAAAHHARHAFAFVQPNADQLAEIGKLLDSKKIRVVLYTSIPLIQASEAHVLSQRGHVRGKIVLETSLLDPYA